MGAIGGKEEEKGHRGGRGGSGVGLDNKFWGGNEQLEGKRWRVTEGGVPENKSGVWRWRRPGVYVPKTTRCEKGKLRGPSKAKNWGSGRSVYLPLGSRRRTLPV